MGQTATVYLSYGFIIPQPKVLQLLRKLQNRTDEVYSFRYSNKEDSPATLEALFDIHLKEMGIGHETFKMKFLTSCRFDGLVILYTGLAERVVVGVGSTHFEPLSPRPWDNAKRVEDADAAFKWLSEDSLFNELEIGVNPEWLLGCKMDE